MCFVSVVTRFNIYRQNDDFVCLQWVLYGSAHPVEHWEIYTKKESLAGVNWFFFCFFFFARNDNCCLLILLFLTPFWCKKGHLSLYFTFVTVQFAMTIGKHDHPEMTENECEDSFFH